MSQQVASSMDAGKLPWLRASWELPKKKPSHPLRNNFGSLIFGETCTWEAESRKSCWLILPSSAGSLDVYSNAIASLDDMKEFLRGLTRSALNQLS